VDQIVLKPIVGFCHGAFAVNDLSGGINGYIDGHVQTEHEIIMDNKIHTVNSYHGQSIQKLGPDMETIAMDMDGNIEAFRHKTLPIYGVVWHPERMNNSVLPKDIERILL
jgi:putative glutamine amidotransferase